MHSVDLQTYSNCIVRLSGYGSVTFGSTLFLSYCIGEHNKREGQKAEVEIRLNFPCGKLANQHRMKAVFAKGDENPISAQYWQSAKLMQKQCKENASYILHLLVGFFVGKTCARAKLSNSRKFVGAKAMDWLTASYLYKYECFQKLGHLVQKDCQTIATDNSHSPESLLITLA